MAINVSAPILPKQVTNFDTSTAFPLIHSTIFFGKNPPNFFFPQNFKTISQVVFNIQYWPSDKGRPPNDALSQSEIRRSKYLYKIYVRFNYVEIEDSAEPMQSICFQKPHPKSTVFHFFSHRKHRNHGICLPDGKRFSHLHIPHSILKCSHPKTASILRFISCSRFWGQYLFHLNTCS